MAFVRLSEASDYGTPYKSMQAAQYRAREDMSYAVNRLAEHVQSKDFAIPQTQRVQPPQPVEAD